MTNTKYDYVKEYELGLIYILIFAHYFLFLDDRVGPKNYIVVRVDGHCFTKFEINI